MAQKKYMFINLRQSSSMVSNVTHAQERVYRAYDSRADERHLYVSIAVIDSFDKDLARRIAMDAVAPETSTPQ